MSSLPSHHGFFFLDAFVSTSFLVALYHSIRSLLLPDIIPHLVRWPSAFLQFMISRLTVLATCIGPQGASAQPMNSPTQEGGIYDTLPKITVWSSTGICNRRRDGSMAGSYFTADLIG